MQEPGYVAIRKPSGGSGQGGLCLVCSIETGNFDDFHDIPFSQEANLQMKWSVLPTIPGTKQYDTTSKQEVKE